MWKLKSTSKDHVEHFCLVGEQCVVGRKDSSLLIANDPSVSRKHAVLYVQHSLENLNNTLKKSSLFLRDEGSKYGTFKNGVRLTSEEELADGDIIKFGQFESEYKVYNIPLIVTTSCLDASYKTKIRKTIFKLGGHILSEWQPCCSHLVMSQVKVTIKALCCLISCKPIVLPQYFEDLEKSLSSSSILPPSQFIPPTGESLIDKDQVSFDINPVRKTVFDGKNFFFMNEKQFKKLHLGIILGGGNASILVDDVPDLTILLKDGSCFVEPIKDQIVTEDAKSLLRNIISMLQNKNLRMIPESDIGLAVAYCSTEKFCNPKFNLGAAVLGSQTIQSQSLSEREVYAPDTEEKQLRTKRALDVRCEPSLKKQKLENESSLNLTSFRDENADFDEIPLSSSIKKELDSMFEETFQTKVQNEPKTDDCNIYLASTLQIDGESEIKEIKKDISEFNSVTQNSFLKNETIQENISKIRLNSKTSLSKSSVSQRNYQEDFDFPTFHSPEKRCSAKIIKDSPAKICSPITTKDSLMKRSTENSLKSTVKSLVQDDSLLPCNLVKVQFADLICKKSVVPQQNNIRSSSVKNFKKFKKVHSLRAQVLPRIIGIHELVAYDRDAVKIFNDKWDDPPEVMEDHPVRGEFDWDTPSA